MLKSFVPNEVKIVIRVDDNRLRSNLTLNETKKFSTKSFFYIILGFTQSHWGPSKDTPNEKIGKMPESSKKRKRLTSAPLMKSI